MQVESGILRVRLLGGLSLQVAEGPLPAVESGRAESLLAYLLLHRDAPQSRQHLAFLLWPDSAEPQARTNLRHVLHTLRRALPELDRLLEVTPRTLQWRGGAPVSLDVAAFEAALATADSAGDDDDVLAALRNAAGLYSGDLLEGCYDEWLLGERERLRQRHLGALDRLVMLLEARGELAEAIACAERAVEMDPLREQTYQALMRLHAARGDRARALRTYHACAAVLERELGVQPSAATRAAYEAALPPEPATAAGARGPAAPLGGPPLVGRAAERARLAATWQQSERGRAQLVLVTGEPGIGKSRLIEELRLWCAHRGAATAHARAYPAEGDLAYGMVVAWLRSEPLRSGAHRVDRTSRAELAGLLPELRAERGPDTLPPPDGDPRRRLFDALAASILATQRPLLLVADDLQWCDRETLQFLHYLLRLEPGARLLVAATARWEDLDPAHPVNDLVAGLRALDRVTELELARLSRQETSALAEWLAGGSLDEPARERLHDETEGNPLFVVEALRAGWTGDRAEAVGISPKVQAVIESRLARLSSPARELVAVAATIGREFTAELLALAAGADQDTLVGALDELWRRRIVREQGADAYDFSHDKIREVAYLALGPARRRRHHLQVAEALERVHGADPGPLSAQLAAHYDRAGAAGQAIGWYAEAAAVAQRLHANPEAIRLLERAVELAGKLPEAGERDGRELALRTALLAPLGAVEGFASPRLHAQQRRALVLARAIGAEPAPPLLRSLAISGLVRSRFQEAREVAGNLLASGEQDGDDVLAVEGRYVLGISAFWQGMPAAARGHFEAAVASYRPEHRATHLVHYGLDPKVVCQSRLANTLWFLGYPEEARRASDAALALAEEIAHVPSRATAVQFAGLLAVELGDQDAVRRHAATLAGTRDRGGRAAELSWAIWTAYLDAVEGRGDDGFTRMASLLDDALHAQAAPGMVAIILRLLQEACVRSGDARRGLWATRLGLAMAGGVRLWLAETHRLRAEFLSAAGASAAAEEELGRAIAVARQQGAVSLQLRAAASLLRLRLAQGDGRAVAATRRLLAATLERIPERGGMPEVGAAAALLARS